MLKNFVGSAGAAVALLICSAPASWSAPEDNPKTEQRVKDLERRCDDLQRRCDQLEKAVKALTDASALTPPVKGGETRGPASDDKGPDLDPAAALALLPKDLWPKSKNWTAADIDTQKANASYQATLRAAPRQFRAACVGKLLLPPILRDGERFEVTLTDVKILGVKAQGQVLDGTVSTNTGDVVASEFVKTTVNEQEARLLEGVTRGERLVSFTLVGALDGIRLDAAMLLGASGVIYKNSFSIVVKDPRVSGWAVR